jgi:hypothetical protein
MVNKSKEREELQLLVKEFLDKGGVIQQVPEGKRGKCLPRSEQLPVKYHKQPKGARCLICDWSPTNSQSIMNPEVEEESGHSLKIDSLTGDMLCMRCLGAVAKMNRDFKIEQNSNYGFSPYILDDAAKKLLSSESHFSEFRGKRQVYDPVLGHISEGSKQKGNADATDS